MVTGSSTAGTPVRAPGSTTACMVTPFSHRNLKWNCSRLEKVTIIPLQVFVLLLLFSVLRAWVERPKADVVFICSLRSTSVAKYRMQGLPLVGLWSLAWVQAAR